MGLDDPSRLTVSNNYNPNEPGQTRIDHFGDFQKLLKYSTYAYYRDKRTLPGSLDDLRSSGWLVFEPLPITNLENFQIVNRQITDSEEDLMNVELIFNPPNGYQFAYLLPPVPGQEGDLQMRRYTKDSLINDFESTQHQFDVFSPYIDSDENHIRQELMWKACMVFMTRYWMIHRELPTGLNDLLQSRFSPNNEIISEWPEIPLGESGSFYYGVNIEKGIAVTAYYFSTEYFVMEQRRYIENDPDAQSPGVIGQPLCEQDYIPIEETMVFVSSELPAWGFEMD